MNESSDQRGLSFSANTLLVSGPEAAPGHLVNSPFGSLPLLFGSYSLLTQRAPGKCQKTIISLEAKWYLGSQLTHFQPALLLLVAFSLDSAPTFFRSFLRAKSIWFTCSRASLGLGIKVLFC